MHWDRWERAFRTTLSFGGTDRRIEIARLSHAEQVDLNVGHHRWRSSERELQPSIDPPLASLLTGTDEQRCKDLDDHAWNVAKNAWMNSVIAAYVRPLDPWESDGYPVATGEDIVKTYQDDILLSTCIMAIVMHNNVSEADRKNLPSPLDLQRSLVEAARGTGRPRARTVESAESSSSASPADATARNESDPSGTTEGTEKSARSDVPSWPLLRTSDALDSGLSRRTNSSSQDLVPPDGVVNGCLLSVP